MQLPETIQIYLNCSNDGDTIMVGGLSRSGKTTFSNVLRDVLRDQNKNAHVISLDRWLRSDTDRQEGVLGRYDLDAIEELISKIAVRSCRPLKLDLPGYHKLTKKQILSVEKIEIQKSDIVIIEGTIALQMNIKLQDVHRFFINLNESVRKDRVINEYLLRKYSFTKATNIYNDRQLDETPVIKKVGNIININMDEFYNNINSLK